MFVASLEVSDDGKEIQVQFFFFWQPRVNHGRFDVIPLSEVPSSSYSLSRSGGDAFHVSKFPDEPRHAVTSGEIFTFRTPNPTTHPLPSFALLDRQWCLTRTVSMSGAADIFDEFEFVYDDDDDYEGPGVEYPHDPPDILNWADSVPSSPAAVGCPGNNFPPSVA